MAVDVQAEVIINQSRDQVVEYAMNPVNDPFWVTGITEAKMLTDPPLGRGTQVQRIAKFLGRRIQYVLEVTEFDPTSLMAMRSIKGPFPMHVTYSFDESEGGTQARIRVRGDAGGFYRLASPLLSRQVKRSIIKDLKNLKRIMESNAHRS